MNILFVDNYTENPFIATYGGQQRTNLLLKACCNVGHVDLVFFSDEKIIPDIENCDIVYSKKVGRHAPSLFARLWRRIKCFFIDSDEIFSNVNREKERIIDEIIKKNSYDIIVSRYISESINCGLLKYNTRLVIDIDDNPVTVLRNNAFNSKSWAMKVYFYFTLQRASRVYSSILKRINNGFCSNFRDVILGQSVYLPNIPFYTGNAEYADYKTLKNNILFIGLISYKPNLCGLNHFFSYIYPKIKKRIPDLTVSIVGCCDMKKAPAWTKYPGVFVKGFVEDIYQEYANAKLAIVPIYSGAGTNIKVIEAFQMKRPCVTTLKGASGFCDIFEDKKDFCICNDDDSFAESVISILQDEEENIKMCKNAYAKVCRKFSIDDFFYTVKETLQKANTIVE